MEKNQDMSLNVINIYHPSSPSMEKRLEAAGHPQVLHKINNGSSEKHQENVEQQNPKVVEEDLHSVSVLNVIDRLFKDFGDATQLHGCRRAIIRSRWRRAIWLVLLFAAVGWGIYNFVEVLKDYYSYPVTSLVMLQYSPTLAFPAVTVCNMNRKRKSEVSPELLEKLRNITNQDAFSDHEYQRQLSLILRQAQLNAPDSGLQQNFKDIIVDCFFDEDKCISKEEYFHGYGASIYGECFTFNFNNLSGLSTNRAGPMHGFVVEMNIEQDQYIDLTQAAGIKVLIHDQTEPPFPEDGGILAAPGQVTSIGIKRADAKLLPAPYGTCVSNTDLFKSERNLYASFGYKYTENACWKSCYQRRLVESCGCCDFDIPCQDSDILDLTTKSSDKDSQKSPYCALTEEILNCTSRFEQDYFNHNVMCQEGCPPACDRTVYRSTISATTWPSEANMDTFFRKISKTSLKDKKFNTTEERNLYIRQNFVRLEVYFETLEVETMEVQPIYDWFKVVGNIGGHLGLCIGFSMLTFMEAIELMLDSFYVLLSALLKRFLPSHQIVDMKYYS